MICFKEKRSLICILNVYKAKGMGEKEKNKLKVENWGGGSLNA